jgi:NitT/TauT family transport system substrate-binding protein
MKNTTPRRFALTPLLLAMLAGGLALAGPAAAGSKLTKVKLAIDEDPIVIRLAGSLGYFKQEGLEIVPVKVESFEAEDYLMQRPLIKGQIDASFHWFNHALFGARHNLPIKAVMVFNDAPGMTVMVANRVRGQVKSAADFKGRAVAEGAGYGTKSVLTGYLTKQAGLPDHSYTSVMLEHDGREKAVLSGLRQGKVDVMTFQEPVTSTLRETGLVSTLYDLNSKESTTKVLGAAWPAQSLLMAPKFIEEHPDTVQHLVNSMVRTMRFINTHTAEQIAEKLPASYFQGKDRKAEIKYIKNTLPTYAKGDYTFAPAAVKLVVDSIQSSSFDKSVEGRWRGTAENKAVRADQLYTNSFVEAAQKAIKQ